MNGKRIRRLLALIASASILFTTLPGCTGTGDPSEKNDGTIRIVTTIFPEYDWVMNVLGKEKDRAKVTMLLDNGVDLHSFQPTAKDILEISTCDLFLYVGGESDKWVEDALKNGRNDRRIDLNLLEILGDKAKEEEVIEGMEAEEEEEGEDGEEAELDEHVWLSLRNASLFIREIAKTLGEIDPERKDVYQANADAYIAKLDELDKEYEAAVASGTKDTLLFGDRFPFRYLVDDYGLKYYAAFVGCSAETEASFETIAFLAGKVDELSLHSVMAIEGTDHRIAETIIRSTKEKNQAVRTLNSMQNCTSKDVQNGETYLGIMDRNLEVLQEALR